MKKEHKKTLTGTVVSLKQQQTVIVEVIRHVPHPIYKKLLRKSKKYQVDSEGVTVAMGDTVKIVETKPISKNKYFKIMEVIK